MIEPIPVQVNIFTDPTAHCPCVSEHVPKVTGFELHHILPLAWGGPDTFGNRILICPTAHASAHLLLNRWLRLSGEPPWEFRRNFSPFIRALAEDGWNRRAVA